MRRVFEILRRLRAGNAVHRKGFKINEATPELVSSYVVCESAELMESILRKLTRDEILDEMGDVMAALTHVALILGIEEDEIMRRAAHKLDMRFTITDKV